jgi:hypothetical protein
VLTLLKTCLFKKDIYILVYFVCVCVYIYVLYIYIYIYIYIDEFGKCILFSFLLPFTFSLFYVLSVHFSPCLLSLQSISQSFSFHRLLPFHVLRIFLLYILTLAFSSSSFRLIPPFPWYYQLTNRSEASVVHLLVVFDKMSDGPRDTSLRTAAL